MINSFHLMYDFIVEIFWQTYQKAPFVFPRVLYNSLTFKSLIFETHILLPSLLISLLQMLTVLPSLLIVFHAFLNNISILSSASQTLESFEISSEVSVFLFAMHYNLLFFILKQFWTHGKIAEGVQSSCIPFTQIPPAVNNLHNQDKQSKP